jgi:hypothetical protein
LPAFFKAPEALQNYLPPASGTQCDWQSLSASGRGHMTLANQPTLNFVPA